MRKKRIFKYVLYFILFSFIITCTKEDFNRIFQDKSLDYSDCPPLDFSFPIISIDENDSNYLICDSEGNMLETSKKCILSIDTSEINDEIVFRLFNDSIQSFPAAIDSSIIFIDSIIINPSGNAPLTAIIKLRSLFPTSVSIFVVGKSEQSAEISHRFTEVSQEHEIPVFGLYPDYSNQVLIGFYNIDGRLFHTENVTIQTGGGVRYKAGPLTVLTNNLSSEQKNRLFLITNTIYDASGDVRWVTSVKGARYYPLADHKFAVQTYADRGVRGSLPDIKIIDIFGNILDTFYIPTRVHHEISEKTPGGNLLFASNHNVYENLEDDTEDRIIEMDRNTGKYVKQWELRNIFDQSRPRLWTEQVNDWCHLNSIQYDSTDNTLLISSKLQYFISKIDYNTGNIKWILGNHENWVDPWRQYLLTPLNFDSTSNDANDWTYAQHMPRLTYDGHILVYDNGASRPGDDFTRAVEFSVDENNMTVRKEWSYVLPGIATAVGGIHRFKDNTTQIGHGSKKELYVVDRDGSILFKGELMQFYRSYPYTFYQRLNTNL